MKDKAGQACLEEESPEKVAQAASRTVDRDERDCLASPQQLPDFAYAGSSVVNQSARSRTVELTEDLFGPDLGAATLVQTKVGAKCQQQTSKAAGRYFDTLWKLALNANKLALEGKQVTQAESSQQLQLQVLGYLEGDPKGKVAKSEAKLTKAVVNKCLKATADSVAGLFPGACSDVSVWELGTCTVARTRCRFCQTLNEFNGLNADCDQFDDGVDDDSCTDIVNGFLD